MQGGVWASGLVGRGSGTADPFSLRRGFPGPLCATVMRRRAVACATPGSAAYSCRDRRVLRHKFPLTILQIVPEPRPSSYLFFAQPFRMW
jgi:hypothetical protein